MIPIQTIRDRAEYVIERLAAKKFDAKQIVADIIEIDAERRKLQNQLDQIKAKNNAASKEIGALFKSGKTEEAAAKRAEIANAKSEIQELDSQLSELEIKQQETLVLLPNIPCYQVPEGASPVDNKVIKESGNLQKSEGLLPHWDVASKYNLIDFELGNKITGAGFPVYLGKGARLQRALMNFFLDQNTEAGYLEVQPPTLVNEDSAYGTGQLPDKEGQMYHVQNDSFYMIPTSEVPLTNIYRNNLLDENELPVKLTAYTSCFRREAGSYGKDVRGLNRLHQFEKVELVRIEKAENSYAALEEMVKHVEQLLIKLELPYRILALCGGDMSFTSAFTYDFEVYSPAQERWLEVSSVSNFEDYQANRLKLRYRNADKKNVLAHTLNGSSLAFPRIVAALLENNQVDGKIKIPAALIPYTGFDTIG